MEKVLKHDGLQVEIAGVPLTMRYTLNSLCEIEARAGMPLDELMCRQFSATRLLLWAGLTECQRELSVWDVGELITKSLLRGGSLESIVELCAAGLRSSGLLAAADAAM